MYDANYGIYGQTGDTASTLCGQYLVYPTESNKRRVSGGQRFPHSVITQPGWLINWNKPVLEPTQTLELHVLSLKVD